ncbi:hypothetical protein HDZ31DRAFT_36587 [Schizophyllum fasciatum]
MNAEFMLEDPNTQAFCAQRDILPTFLINSDDGMRGAAADQSVHDAIVRAHKLAADSWGGSPPSSPKRLSRATRSPPSPRVGTPHFRSYNSSTPYRDTSRQSRRYSEPAILHEDVLELGVNEVHEKIQRWAIRTRLQADPAFPLIPADDELVSLPPSPPSSPSASPKRPKWRRMLSLNSLPARVRRNSITTLALPPSPTSPTWPASPSSPTAEASFSFGTAHRPVRSYSAPAVMASTQSPPASPTYTTFECTDLPVHPTPTSPKSTRTLKLSLRGLVRGRRRSDSTGSRVSDASEMSTASKGSTLSASSTDSSNSQASALTSVSGVSGTTAATSVASATLCGSTITSLYGSTICEEPLPICEEYQPFMLSSKLEALAEEASDIHSAHASELAQKVFIAPQQKSRKKPDDDSSVRAIFRDARVSPASPPPSRRVSKVITLDDSQEALAQAFHEVYRPESHPLPKPTAIRLPSVTTPAIPISTAALPVTPSPARHETSPAPTTRRPGDIAWSLIYRSLSFGWLAPVFWMVALAMYAAMLTATALAGLHVLTFEGASAATKIMTGHIRTLQVVDKSSDTSTIDFDACDGA